MTFRHLANNMSGYALPELPGTRWGYNDYAASLFNKVLFLETGLFGAMPQQVLASRMGSLQFQDGTVFGSRLGFGVQASSRDFARIGWLWLNRGAWSSGQLLSTTLFDAHLHAYVPGSLPRTVGGVNDYLGVGSLGGGTNQQFAGPGVFGHMWWFNDIVGNGPFAGNRHWPDAPADLYQAVGHWNQEIVTVIPSLGIVVATRGRWGSFDPGNPDAGMNHTLSLLVAAASSD